MIDYPALKAWSSGELRQTYGARDTILYALGVGAGTDPLDEAELRLVYEKNLEALPGMACVLASPGSWMREHPELGIDFLRMVHGEQRLEIHAPLQAEGTVVGVTRITHAIDKGEGKGAVVYAQKTLTDPDGKLLATVTQGLFCRGDGGFSAAGAGSDEAPATLQPVPATPPDVAVELPTRPETAALYRLSGDWNPLHIDPAVAAKAGFQKPILHGLALYGLVCRGLVRVMCGNEPSRLKSLQARFSAPVYPGETIRLECWRTAEGAGFQASSVERKVVVLSHGSMR